MIKQKRKILITIAIAVVLAILSVTAVFAYNIIVEYNYQFTTHADVLSTSLIDDGQTLTINRNSDLINATKADLVVISPTDKIVLLNSDQNIFTPSHTTITQNEFNPSNTHFKLVFKNLPLNQHQTQFTIKQQIEESLVPATLVSVLKSAVAQAKYTTDTQNTITYHNEYISTVFDLKLLNLQSNFNDIFELAGNYISNTISTGVIYFLNDITLTDDFNLNIPYSINLLDSKLTLNANLTLSHPYAGGYFITKETDSASINGTNTLTIKTPKAYYNINAELKNALTDSRLIEYYDFTQYGDQILADALDFAQNLIPTNIFSDLILQHRYQSLNVDFSYTISGQTKPFSGRVSTTAPVPEGTILRNTATTPYTISIKASRGEKSASRQVTIRAIGTGAKASTDWLQESFKEKFTQQNKVYSHIELKEMFKDLYISGGYNDDTTISISESETTLLPEDENSAKLLYNGTPTLSVKVGYDPQNDILLAHTPSGTQQLNSLIFKRGTVTISDQLTVSFNSQSENSTHQYDLTPSSNAQILYYLKTSSPAFTTNKNYSLLNISDLGVFIGQNRLTSSKLGLNTLEWDIVLVDGQTQTAIDPTQYFTYENNTLKVTGSVADIPNNLYLRYKCFFQSAPQQETILIHVFRTLADDGGENQQFESINPFDQLFMNTDTNWIEGGKFQVASTAEIYYAKIEILSINGAVYVPSAQYNICAIQNEGNSVIYGNDSYFKTISFITYQNYIPDRNTLVKVRCFYYNDEASSVVLTQDYTVIIPGIYKCGSDTQATGDTPYVFADSDFYAMTISLYEAEFGNEMSYVSTLSNGEKILLSDSSYATITLDYSIFATQYNGNGLDLKGIERLKRVPSISLNGLKIANISTLNSMYDSSLESLFLSNCSLTNTVLYANETAKSYLHSIHLKTVDLSLNSIERTDFLVSRTVTNLNLSTQRTDSTPCLIDISGLDSVKDIEILNISNNAIFRFEVLKTLNKLKAVYLHNNLVENEFKTYGTNGLINVPHFVWIIKELDVKIYAKTQPAPEDYLKIDPTASGLVLFSDGGNISSNMQKGSVGLNAFASPTRLYSIDAKNQLQNDVANLKIQITPDGAEGSNVGTQTEYTFVFFNPNNGEFSNSFVLIKDYQTVLSVNATAQNPILCSYILAIKEGENVLAMREFIINIHYNYSAI